MSAASLDHPLLLALGPLAVALLLLLERLRRRPLEVVVADLTLFRPTPGAEREARAARRRASLRVILLALAALALAAAAAGPRGPAPPAGPLEVDLVLDRGPGSAVVGPDGARVLDRRRAHLLAALGRLREGDRARVHLAPGEPGETPLAPDVARAVLAAARPVAAAADLEEVARRSRAGAPLLVATGASSLHARPGLLVALVRASARDRGLVALVRDGAGDVHAVVAAHDAAGTAHVAFTATRPDGVVTGTRAVELPARGLARVTWSRADGAPAGALALEARLVEPDGSPWRDALALDDGAFAAAGRGRRVGLMTPAGLRGDAAAPWAAVRDALAAVPGATIVELSDREQRAGPLAALVADLDLLVVAELPLVFPPVAIARVPVTPPRGVRGGRLIALDHPARDAFRHALDEVGRVAVDAIAGPERPDGVQAAPLLACQVDGGAAPAPLVYVEGRGRALLVALSAPPAPAWTRHESWPLLWAEALALAAPAGDGRAASVTAGEPLPGGGRAPLDVTLARDVDGAPRLGTVAPPVDELDLPALDQPFAAADLDGLDAARRPGERARLGPWLALVGLALALAAWAART